jgi:hypothetical protein
MTDDPGARQPNAPRPDFELPEVRDIRIRRVPFEPPRRRNFDSSLSDSDEVVEFVVTTEAPIPTRDLGPALYIGSTPVIECEPIDDNVYRFLALQPKLLERGAPIRLGWTGQEPEHRGASYDYDPDADE